jgi:RNA polymerase sigma factor (sigma-70 family)
MQQSSQTRREKPRLTPSHFGEIVEQFSGNLTHYAYVRTGNLETAREIVQEVFLRLARSDFDKISDHLAPWLFCVCRNLSADFRQKRSRWDLLPNDILDDHHQSAEPNPIELSEEQEARTLLAEAITSLPEREQEVLYLKFRNNLKYHEIAKITSLSIGHVGYILHHAVANLRTCITNHL